MKNNLYRIVLALFIALSLSAQIQTEIPWATLAQTDWPMIKHDPQFTGRSPYKGPQTPTIVWTADLEHGIFSGPVIGENGNLFFGSYFQFADDFYSYSANGDFRWSYQTGREGAPQTGVLIDSSNTIYFGASDGVIYALNSDGTLKWEYATGGYIFESTIPNIDLEGNLYFSNFDGYLFSINPKGELKWKVKYESGFHLRSVVFSPDGETMYIAGKDSSLFALYLDGTIKWKFNCGEIKRAPLVDNEGNIYFVPISLQYFYSLNSNGSIRWQKSVNSSLYSIPTIDSKGNTCIIAVDSAHFPEKALYSFDYEGNLRWKYSLNGNIPDDFWQPLICDSEGTVYVGSTFGNYYYAISSEGELKWKLPLNNYQVDNTGAISKDGTLYLGVHQNSVSTGFTNTLIAIRDTGLVSVENEETPTEFGLEQNYPNPFNPSTTISYTIPSDDFVSLKIYDVLGEEITILVNENQAAGRYNVEFNATVLPSGVYFYKIQTGVFSSTKKLILSK